MGGLRHADVLDLRVGEHLVHPVDRAARHACLVERFHPLGGSALAGLLLDDAHQLDAVLVPQLEVAEIRVCFELRHADHLAQPGKQVARARDVDVPVRRSEGAGGHVERVIVADLLRHLVRHHPARGLEIEHRDQRLQERGGDPLAFAGLLALEQRGDDAEREVDAGTGVADGDPGAHRAFAGPAGDRHEPAHALRDLVEAGAVGVRPVLPEAADAGVDDARIDLAHRLVIDAEPQFHLRPVILNDHIRGLRHLLEDRHPFGRLEVQRHAPLVAVHVLEIRPVPAVVHGPFLFSGLLDLDDVGAPVGKLPHGRRAGARAREIEDGKAGQRPLALVFRHGHHPL